MLENENLILDYVDLIKQTLLSGKERVSFKMHCDE